MYSEENRAFSFAVLASIVLHGMLLFGVSQPRRPPPAPEPPAPLLARIAEPPAPAPVVIPPEVKPPSTEEPKPKARPKAEKKPKPMAKPVPKPAPEPAPAPAPAPQVAEPAPMPEPAPAVPPVIARTEPVVPAAPAAQPPVDTAPDPRTIAEYRMLILGAAPRYKRYPPAARENNWEGLVALRMQFGANGRLAELSVTKTSGHDVLDKQAAEMFRNAAEAVPVPPVLRGKAFSVDVAAVYGLRD